MTDYTNLIDKVNIPELVKALLSASTVSTAWGKLMLDAAAAIEALLKENKELIGDHPEMVEADGHWEWRKPNGEVLMPKRGEWKSSYPEIEPNPMFMYGICSICGFEQSISNKLNYCPNCGAKMEAQNGESNS